MKVWLHKRFRCPLDMFQPSRPVFSVHWQNSAVGSDSQRGTPLGSCSSRQPYHQICKTLTDRLPVQRAPPSVLTAEADSSIAVSVVVPLDRTVPVLPLKLAYSSNDDWLDAG